MGSGGSVVTAAGLVLYHDVVCRQQAAVMAQVGTTIGMGLLFAP